jgi:hypothetical protein
LKHQRPHHTEAESTIPEYNSEQHVNTPLEDGEAPDGREGKGKEGKGREGNGVYVDFEESTRQMWNYFCEKFPTLSKIQQITETRRKHLKQRFEEPLFRNFSEILKAVEEQPFLIHGNQNNEKHKNWRIDFDWLIKNDQNYVKVIERRYKEKSSVPEGLKKYL